jgi:hypothetical protein
MPKIKLTVDEKPRKLKLTIREEKKLSPKELAINYIKTGLIRDKDMIHMDVLYTRSGTTESKLGSTIGSEARKIAVKLINNFLKELENKKEGMNDETKT